METLTYDEFKTQENQGMKRRYETYCAGARGLVGKVVTTLTDAFGSIGNLYHVDSVDFSGIHLKNGPETFVCPLDHYWRLIVLYD